MAFDLNTSGYFSKEEALEFLGSKEHNELKVFLSGIANKYFALTDIAERHVEESTKIAGWKQPKNLMDPNLFKVINTYAEIALEKLVIFQEFSKDKVTLEFNSKEVPFNPKLHGHLENKEILYNKRDDFTVEALKKEVFIDNLSTIETELRKLYEAIQEHRPEYCKEDSVLGDLVRLEKVKKSLKIGQGQGSSLSH